MYMSIFTIESLHETLSKIGCELMTYPKIRFTYYASLVKKTSSKSLLFFTLLP